MMRVNNACVICVMTLNQKPKGEPSPLTARLEETYFYHVKLLLD